MTIVQVNEFVKQFLFFEFKVYSLSNRPVQPLEVPWRGRVALQVEQLREVALRMAIAAADHQNINNEKILICWILSRSGNRLYILFSCYRT